MKQSIVILIAIAVYLVACDPSSSGGGEMAGVISQAGEVNGGENTAGEVNDGENTAGEANDGENTAGEVNGGENTPAEVNGGESLAGEVHGDEQCMSPIDYFTQVAWPEVFKDACSVCHQQGSPAQYSRLVFTSNGSSVNLDDYEQIRLLINDQNHSKPTLLLKPTGLHPEGHGGGNILRNGDQRLDILVHLAERELGLRDECGVFTDDSLPINLFPQNVGCEELQPGRRMLRRLSHQEYQHTIYDLLGVEMDAKATFVADPSKHGFDNPPEDLKVSGLLVNQYREVAELLGDQVSLEPILPCLIADGDIQCAQNFIINFGQRVYRRPLSQDEVNRYLELYRLVVNQECFEQGIRWIVVALLQSPHFLYRSELGWKEGDHFTLSSYEIASELSYLVWQSMPDDTLFDLAARGQLLDPQIVQAQLQRMLTDPRSIRTAQYFVERWLHLDRLMQVTRDSIIYAALYFELREMMLTETQLFVEELWHSNSSFTDLFTAQHSWINAELAAYYGLELGEAHPTRSDYYFADTSATRPAGIFTQGAFLTTHAAPTSSSPILRGVTVREQVLCDHLDPPPEGLEIVPPSFDPNLSTRERFAAHTENPQCASCHSLIDPLGFAFENYDGIGRYRTVEGDEGMEILIDSSGVLQQDNGEATMFSGIAELSASLSEDQKVQSCYVHQWLRFGIGESEGLDTDCYTHYLLDQFQINNQSLQSPLNAIINTPHFFKRNGEATELSLPAESYLVKTVMGEPDLSVDPLTDDMEDPVCGVPPMTGGGSAGISDPRLDISEREDRWSSGYCLYVTVTNTSDDQIEGWVVQLSVEGTINNAWNVERSGDTGEVNFSPVEWNRTIYPQGSLEFGFCGQL